MTDKNYYKSSHKGKNFYEILGISSRDANRKVILQIGLRKICQAIKDKDKDGGQEILNRLLHVTKVLSDPHLRCKYDESLLQECDNQQEQKHKIESESNKDRSCNDNGHSSTPKQVYGINQNGKECRRCIRQGSFCYWHSYQGQAGSEKTVVEIFGYTQKGLPCKRCIKQRGYCFQHAAQQKGNKN